jgi:hypothetical protein
VGDVLAFPGEVLPDGSGFRVKPASRPLFLAYLATMAGAVVEVVIRPPRRKRTHDQLRYWFGVPMKRFSEHTGYTKLQAHYLCLALCFGVIYDPASGREVPVVPMSKGLSAAQFAELIEWFVHYAATTYGLAIPLPNEPECPDLDSLPGMTEDEARAA